MIHRRSNPPLTRTPPIPVLIVAMVLARLHTEYLVEVWYYTLRAAVWCGG